MIIFGTRGVTSTKDTGTFYCPGCGDQQPYKLKNCRQFFTLYFIPVIPMKNLGEYVECQTCKETYQSAVLQYDPNQAAEKAVAEFHDVTRRVMVHMMLADGKIEDHEVQTITSIYQQLTGQTLTPDDVRAEASDGTVHQDICEYLAGIAEHLNDTGRELVIKAAFLVASSDGEIADSEAALLYQLGQALGMSHNHLKAVIDELTEPTTEPIDHARDN